jgi:hypothetical protein
MHLTVVMRLGPLHEHLIPIVAMKGIAVNDDCLDAKRFAERSSLRSSCPHLTNL